MTIRGDAERGAKPPQGKLGCVHAPSRDRVRLPEVMAKTKTPAPRPPSTRDWSREIRDGGALGSRLTYDAFGNDRYGCCTCATYGTIDTTVAARMGTKPVVTRAVALQAYDAISAWDQALPTANDNGAQIEDAANYFAWWDGDKTANGGLIPTHVGIDLTRRAEIELAIDLAVAIVVTFDLPKSIWTKKQKVWDVAPRGDYHEDYERGSLGGHSVGVMGYDGRGILVGTWGQTIVATWEFLSMYHKDGIVPVHRALAHTTALTPSGYFAREIIDVVHTL